MPTFSWRHARPLSLSPARQRGALSRPVTALIALVVLAGAAVAITYLFLNRGATPAVASVPAPAPAPAPIFVKLDPFTTSITNQNIERLLYVGLTLRLADERNRNRLDQYLPEIRSRLLVLLSEQDPDTLQTAAGKLELASAIRNMLNEGDNGYAVADVLYNAFVVQ